MAYENIRSKSIEEVLNNVQGLAAVASDTQVQSIMALVAKCTIDLGENLGRTSTEIRRFNESTDVLTKQVIRLNRILTWATVVIAIGTIAVAVTAIFVAFKP